MLNCLRDALVCSTKKILVRHLMGYYETALDSLDFVLYTIIFESHCQSCF